MLFLVELDHVKSGVPLSPALKSLAAAVQLLPWPPCFQY